MTPDEMERKLILAGRKAYERALRYMGMSHDNAVRQAEAYYPLPPMTRRREVTVEGTVVRLNAQGYGLEWRTKGGNWLPWHSAKAILMLADLIAHPDEEVPS